MRDVVLLTGATGGIGSAIALKFGKNDYDIVIGYKKNEKKANELASEIGLNRTMTIKADITITEEVKRLVDETIKNYKKIDVLINCAGINQDITFMKMTKKHWIDVIDINLNGIFNVTKEVIPFMTERNKGSIINIASIVGEMGNFGQSNYAASKSALIGFTKSLAKEVAPKGILVNVISPGFINAGMTTKLDNEIKQKITSKIPLGRLGRPDEVADVVYNLSKFSYITGQVIRVDGGMY